MNNPENNKAATPPVNATPQTPTTSSVSPSTPPPMVFGTKKWVKYVGMAIISIILIWVLWLIFIPSVIIKTDDAQIKVDYSIIAPKVPGNIGNIEIKDHQYVKKGQLLAQIDQQDYQIAVAEAEANLTKVKANLNESFVYVERQPSVIREAEAQVRKIEAGLKLTKDTTSRYEQLQSLGAESKLITQEAQTNLLQQNADLEAAKEKVINAKYQLGQYKAQVEASQAALKQAQVSLDKTKLNLSYTDIRAPIDGVVGQKTANLGNYVNAGNPLMVIIPLDKVYIDANFREVQLKNVKVGQPVKIHVDAYNLDLNGVVDSLSASTGAFFSPIAANNATGNFTKIVQRLPIRIKLLENQSNINLLRPGLSVIVSIDTKNQNPA